MQIVVGDHCLAPGTDPALDMVHDLFGPNQIDGLTQQGDRLFRTSLGAERAAREPAPVRKGRSEIEACALVKHKATLQPVSVGEVCEGG